MRDPQQCCDTEKIHAQVRSSIVKILSKRLQDNVIQHCLEDPLVSLLVMEYFKWIGYSHASEILSRETNVKMDLSGVPALRKDLGLPLDDDYPILMSILTMTRMEK